MSLPIPSRHIMILTGEPSGDLHAGRLVKEIKQLDSRIYFSGIGGQYLEQQQVDLFYSIEKLSAMGLTEVLMQFPQIKKAFDRFKKKVAEHRPDLIILVDYPGFNLNAAKFAKINYNIKILYYITPKVWAWKKSRLAKIKKYVDHAALILPFEEKIFKKAKINSTYVGNPLVDEYPENQSRPFLYSKQRLPEEKPLVIGLLPGSRNAEIKNLLGVMIQAAKAIHQTRSQVSFVISKAGSITRHQIEKELKHTDKKALFTISQDPVKDIFIASDMIIAASGTVTLEAALSGVPTIIIYKMSFVSYRIAKLLVKIKFAGLANLIVNKEVMPELLQNNATPEKISQKALFMLDHLLYYQNQLKMVRARLGKKGAATRAARIAVNLIKS